ncbi:MAG: hypothetical protein V4439_00345 [Patescibacteria group bacterium]
MFPIPRSNKKIIELIGVVIYTAIIAYFTITFKLNYLISTGLYFLVPSIYITFRRPSLFKSTAKFALLTGLPFVLLTDSLALFNNAWWETSVFPRRIFNLIPFETVIWAVVYVYLIVSLYNYFFTEQNLQIKILPRFNKFVIILFTVLFVEIFILYTNSKLLTIPYFYLWFVLIFFCTPTIIGLLKSAKRFCKLWLQCLPFSMMLFIIELSALATHQWGFLGSQYLGMVHIGDLSFPIEELSWILFGVPAFIYVYQYFTSKEVSN